MSETAKSRLDLQFEQLTNHPQSVSLAKIAEVFQEKTFAVLILLLMAIPALPLPTGGLTHIFEIVAMLLALELIIGRKVVWLPQRWHKLPVRIQTIKLVLRWVKKVENHSKPRLEDILKNSWLIRALGFNMLVFITFAFLAPLFSGLDTLPSIGAVLIALGVLLDDVMVIMLGEFIGTVGIILILTLGSLIFKLF